MNIIRPVSDLRNNFADISKTVHETAQPVFLTKNGYGDMVVMSMETFEKMQFESDVYFTTWLFTNKGKMIMNKKVTILSLLSIYQ